MFTEDDDDYEDNAEGDDEENERYDYYENPFALTLNFPSLPNFKLIEYKKILWSAQEPSFGVPHNPNSPGLVPRAC